MITADQLLCHAIGDYILQSDWMATEKTRRSVAALCHVLTYALPFLFLRPSWTAMSVIIGTHFVIDRWRLARYVVWCKNFLGPKRPCYPGQEPICRPIAYARPMFNNPWRDCKATGYPPATPTWLAVWLLIIADNTMHVLCNGLALKYLH